MKLQKLPYAALTALAVTGCHGTAMAAGVPDAIAAPPGQSLLFELRATGSQNYECAHGKSGPEWTFRAPEATLADEAGHPFGKHYGGPTWESDDGSTVVGEVVASAPAADAQSVPQLLLKAKSHGGDGRLARVTLVQRLDTRGGRAPTTACAAGEIGHELKVPYTARYAFYGEGADPRRTGSY
ncbi:MAG TPA: DUF3455 domain-containing protein [Usitatibacter sp.]|jgi:hypothetical protein|nr:DUF3455 domain-containing protein [Usitatibacter sp.]